MKTKLKIAKDLDKDSIEKEALNNSTIQGQIEGKTVRKVIVVPGKLVNIVAN